MAQNVKDSTVEYAEQLPKTQCKVRLSNDGKWLIHETIITDIKPVAYYEAAFRNAAKNDSSVDESPKGVTQNE